MDDRKADVKVEAVRVLRSKKFNKFKYVSDHFVLRNGGTLGEEQMGNEREDSDSDEQSRSDENDKTQKLLR